MTKQQIISFFHELLSTIKNWKIYFSENNLKPICTEYKKIESTVSELELCLADYENIFHCNGISYSLFEIGNLINEILESKAKESN